METDDQAVAEVGEDAPLALADLDLGDIDDSDLGAVEREDEDGKPKS